MRKIKLITLTAVAVMALGMTGCGGTSAQTAAEPEETAQTGNTEEVAEEDERPFEEVAEDDEMNPVLNYIGAYTDETSGACSLLVEATDGVNGAYVTIGYPDETTGSYTYWEMSGKIGNDVITYTEGSKSVVSPSESDPEQFEEALVYQDGTGSFEIKDNKITWKDDKEDAGAGMVFVWDEELNQMIQDKVDEGASDMDFSTISSWTGPYYDMNNSSRSMIIEEDAEKENACAITVTESNGETKDTIWMMSGTFNPDTMTVEYSDCVKLTSEKDESGNEIAQETVYENGTGKFDFNAEDMTIQWTDAKEDTGKDTFFCFNYDYEESDTEMAEEDGEELPEEYEESDLGEEGEDIPEDDEEMDP